jgi:DNA-binding transcriptional regulator YbjK
MVTAMFFDDEEQQQRWERFQQRRARYFGRTAQQEVPEIVYKRYEFALQQPEPQPQVAEMDAETLARWNAWLDGRVAEHLDVVAEVVGSEDGKLERRLQNQIDERRTEIKNLKAKPDGT